MSKKLILSIFVIASFFLLVQSVSAYYYDSYGNSYNDWRAYNQYLDDRVVHNRMYDYFRYGSVWQGDVVVDLTYSYPPYYPIPRYIERPRMNYGYISYGMRNRYDRYDRYDYRDYGNYDYYYDERYYDYEYNDYRYRYSDRRDIIYLGDCGADTGYYGNCY